MSRQKRKVSRNCWLFRALSEIYGCDKVYNLRYKTLSQNDETVIHYGHPDVYRYISGIYDINDVEYLYSYTFIIKDNKHIKNCVAYELKRV